MFKLNILDYMFEIQVDNQYVKSYLLYRFGQFEVRGSVEGHGVMFKIEQVQTFEKSELVVLSKRVVETDDYTYENKNKIIRVLNFKNIVIYDGSNKTIRFHIEDKIDKIYFLIALDIYFFIIYFLYSRSIIGLHGGCITLNGVMEDGVIFCGKSGSGKSTIILKMLERQEKFTNDDNLMLKIEGGNLIAYKNPQLVGLQIENLNERFKYLKNYVKSNIKYVEKCRVDYWAYNSGAYADKIYVKKIVWIDSRRLQDAEIFDMGFTALFSELIDSIVPFRNFEINFILDQIIHAIQLCKIYQLVPSQDIESTLKCIYGKLG